MGSNRSACPIVKGRNVVFFREPVDLFPIAIAESNVISIVTRSGKKPSPRNTCPAALGPILRILIASLQDSVGRVRYIFDKKPLFSRIVTKGQRSFDHNAIEIGESGPRAIFIT